MDVTDEKSITVPSIIDTLESCWMCVIDGRSSDFMKYDVCGRTLFCESCGWVLGFDGRKKIVAIQIVDGMCENLFQFMFGLDKHGIRHAYLLGKDYDVMLCAMKDFQRFVFWSLARKYRKMAYFEKNEQEIDNLMTPLRRA